MNYMTITKLTRFLNILYKLVEDGEYDKEQAIRSYEHYEETAMMNEESYTFLQFEKAEKALAKVRKIIGKKFDFDFKSEIFD